MSQLTRGFVTGLIAGLQLGLLLSIAIGGIAMEALPMQTTWMIQNALCHPGKFFCEDYSGMTFDIYEDCKRYRRLARDDAKRWYQPGIIDHALIECLPVDYYDGYGVVIRWGWWESEESSP